RSHDEEASSVPVAKSAIRLQPTLMRTSEIKGDTDEFVSQVAQDVNFLSETAAGLATSAACREKRRVSGVWRGGRRCAIFPDRFQESGAGCARPDGYAARSPPARCERSPPRAHRRRCPATRRS